MSPKVKKTISKSAFSQPPQQIESVSNTHKRKRKRRKQQRMRWRRKKFTVGVDERERQEDPRLLQKPMLWFSKTIYTSNEGVSNDGSGRQPKNKSGLRAHSKCFHQGPQAESKKEELLSRGNEAHWGTGVWELGWDS